MQVAERTITDDLEYLIAQTVDPKKADYAVVTGVQIHSWSRQFCDDTPNLEYVAPVNVYAGAESSGGSPYSMKTQTSSSSVPPCATTVA